jgi:diguanylate cyclase (GGDEF)-like protein
MLMDSFLKVDLHIFSLILCVVMLCADITLSDKFVMQNRLFRCLIVVTAIAITLDTAGVYTDGRPHYFVLSCIAETLLFAVAPLPSCVWALYVSYQLYQDIRRLRIEMRVMTALLFANAILSALSPVYGFIFSIGPQNVYTRGPQFFLLCIASYLPLIYSAGMCILRRKYVSRRLLSPLLSFVLPPLAASVLQVLLCGISLIWGSITISIFIICVSVQVRYHSVDHLTGVFNRRQLDSYLAERIRSAKRGRAFSCIMLDIDSFKAINDTWGHVVGDEALADAAKLLRASIRSEDFLARYAGDEFIIVLDVSDKSALEQTVERIRVRVEDYNQKSIRPFRLDFSVGFDIFDPNSKASAHSFIARIDWLMYENKNSKKYSAAQA